MQIAVAHISNFAPRFNVRAQLAIFLNEAGAAVGVFCAFDAVTFLDPLGHGQGSRLACPTHASEPAAAVIACPARIATRSALRPVQYQDAFCFDA